ncbi:MAG: beta-galactosidase [Candidatus Marinimicrobia bacterium]|nr:beta-galactosidase [Candidatus Neomarinimicrobiota bacterium]
MRHLLSDNYFPFGTQYYRAPSPHSEDWECDLKAIADLGMNTVKYWVQWRWNNPRENEFYFDDIDRLMDLAAENRLKVMLNTIVDVAPAWVYEKYFDVSMVTRDGIAIGPQTQPHRQIGGLGWCLNHIGAVDHMLKFLEVTVERYSNHPALEIWNMGSEPELTSSMAEMRKWSDDASRMGESICYCNNCRKQFKDWLKLRYSSIERLNRVWNRNYSNFSQAEIPSTRNTFNDLIDWRMFFVHTLGENVRHRFEVASSIDQGKHPLMCHHVFIQGFPVVSTASDPWNVGRFGDLHGFTQMDDPMMIDVLRSCARGKPVISAEMLMLPGYTLDLPDTIDADDIKRLIFSGIAGNLKGFIFWQYRPEILGREAPTWGLAHLDGSSTEKLEAYVRVGQVLQANKEFLLEASPAKAKVAIFYNPENQIFAWASTGSEKTATNSIMGIYYALYEKNYVIDFIHPIDFNRDLLKTYQVIIVPFPYVLGETLCRDLEWFVEQGGTLIGEAYFAGWNIDEGHHAKTIPGSGMDKVFGVSQDDAIPVREDNSDIGVVSNLPQINKLSGIKAHLIRESYIVHEAEVLAKYANGKPAVTINRFGQGQAILMGSYIGLEFFTNGTPPNSELVSGLVAMASEISRPIVVNNSRIRIDQLMYDNKVMVIVRNLEDGPIEDTVIFPVELPTELIEQFNQSKVLLTKTANGMTMAVRLKIKEVQVWYG